MDFETILQQAGDYGRYQKRILYLVLIPISLIMPFASESILFMLSEPDHWCIVPQVANLSWSDQHLLTRPPVVGSSLRDHCVYYDIDYSAEVKRLHDHKALHNSTAGFSIENASSAKKKECSSWIFDNSSYDANAVTELQIVCKTRHWKSTLLMMTGIGGMLGSLCFGYCAAKFGRKKTFLIGLCVKYVAIVIPIFVREIRVFVAMRVLAAFTSGGIFDQAFLIMTEIVLPDNRSRVTGISSTCWTIGMCLLPLTAFLIRNWIGLMIVPVVLMFPFFSYVYLLPESPRWLLSQKRYKEAYDVLQSIARVNGEVITGDLMSMMKAINAKPKSEGSSTKRTEDTGSLTEIFKHRRLCIRFLILTVAWIAAYSTYGGLTLNFENFEGNEFMNWFLLSLVEFPSNLLSWYLMESIIGRRWTTSGSLVLGGLVLCAPSFISSTTWVLVLSLIGKLLTNIAFNVLYQQGVELFPTPLRTQTSSYSTAIASAVTLGLPFVISLGKGHVWIPLAVIGSASIAGGIATSFFPETLDQNLPQTIEDGERMGAGRRFFSLATQPISLQPRRSLLEKPRRSVTQMNWVNS